VVSTPDKLNNAVKPTNFGVVVSPDAERFSRCSGGGDGLFETRGLSSLSPSSLGRFAVSAGVVVIEGLSGPWLVPRSASLRFKPFSGSVPSHSECLRVSGRLDGTSAASSTSATASWVGGIEHGGSSAFWLNSSSAMACSSSLSSDASGLKLGRSGSLRANGPRCCQLISSTP